MTVVVDESVTGATDVDLVREVAGGDRDALDLLYERHAGWLTSRLNRRCGDPDMVDTAVQDTFLAVWRQADSYRPTGEVGAWIWTIGLRRLIDQLRKRPPPEPMGDELPLRAVIHDEIPMALADTDLGAAFARLDPDLQAVLAVTAFDGLTTNEAAALLGIPSGTVKSRLSRARRVITEELT